MNFAPSVENHSGSSPQQSRKESLPPVLPVLIIAGPTCSGKTAWGVHFARRLGGEVISADSRQLYRGMEIATAQPDEREKAGIPHHLLGFLEPGAEFDAGQWVRRAAALIVEIHRRGRLPILVGGTGFYLRALVDGIAAPAVSLPGLRDRLLDLFRRGGGRHLHALLRHRDPRRAAEIPVSNGNRLTRALEIVLATGRPIPRLVDAIPPLPGLCPCWLGLTGDRTLLYNRIHLRVERMMAEGLPAELERLLSRADPAVERLVARTIGYRELLPYLAGRAERSGCVALIQRNTRHLARRQYTWFRAVTGIRWFDALNGGDGLAEAEVHVDQMLPRGRLLQ